jgi:hypothetical protein
MSVNGTVPSSVVRPFKSLEQIENERQSVTPTGVYHRLQTVLRDSRANTAALNRVLGMCQGKNIMPCELVERKVSEQIEKDLIMQVAHISREAIEAVNALRRVDPS